MSTDVFVIEREKY